jgi:hypothetical protein
LYERSSTTTVNANIDDARRHTEALAELALVAVGHGNRETALITDCLSTSRRGGSVVDVPGEEHDGLGIVDPLHHLHEQKRPAHLRVAVIAAEPDERVPIYRHRRLSRDARPPGLSRV